MSTQSEIVNIGGQDYRIGKLPSRVGIRVAARLMNVLAPALKNLPEEGALKLESATQIVELCEPLFADSALGDTLVWLTDVLAERTYLVGVHPVGHAQAGAPYQIPLTRVLDEHFSDKYDEMILWFGHALRVSMTSFFRGAKGIGVLFAARPAQPSKSPD